MALTGYDLMNTRTIGEGTHTKVKSAYSEKYERQVALKIMNKTNAPLDVINKFLPREIEIVKEVKHPNIIDVFETFESGQTIYVAMELAPNGNLLDYIASHGAIPEEKSRKMFQQLVDVMDYLHGKHIVHRSLSCENLLLDLHYNIKVSDFSFARHFNDSELSKTFCGSAAYMPPEVLQGNAYEMPAHDVWGMGVILYVMLTGLMPFDDSDIQKQIDAQLKGTTPDRKHVKISVAASDLIRNMLEPVVEERYTLRMIKAHQWLQGITMTQADTKHFRKKTCCIIL